jgi:ATP-dependent DNA helicase RecQ
VQIIRVNDAAQQAVTFVEELLRLRQRNPSLQWSDCAVLAMTREELAPIRALCEHREIPITWGIDKDKTPPLFRLREVRQFLDVLKARHDELLSADDLLRILNELAGSNSNGIWWVLLRKILQEWREESGNAQLPTSCVTEYVYQTLAEQRRDQTIGTGVFLSTVHSAKGMEFPHVFVPGGGWSRGKSPQEQEEERRVYYVAMTRARETLCLFDRSDSPNRHTDALQGDFLLRRDAPVTALPDEMVLRRRYDMLGMEDLFLDYAGRRCKEDPVHKHLAALMPGDLLHTVKNEDYIELHDEDGICVAALSRSARDGWQGRLHEIGKLTVLAMVQRGVEDSKGEFQERCKCDQWEVPIVEVVYTRK